MKIGTQTLTAAALLGSILASPIHASEADITPSMTQSDQAVVVFLRDVETKGTRSLNFNVYLNEDRVARMSVKESKQVTVPAGEYTIQSNFYKDNSIAVNLQPGKTYYLKASMNKGVNTFYTSYKLVSEEYAFNALPALEVEENEELI